MKYFLAIYELRDIANDHTHTGAVIFEAESAQHAYKMALAEEFEPDTDSEKCYLSYGGDGMISCKHVSCQEISKEEMQFLERVGLAYRK
jgi:hypothetical protein